MDGYFYVGLSKCVILSPTEVEVFTKNKIQLPDHCLIYTHLFIETKDRYIMSASRSRAAKRNNSCIVYKPFDQAPLYYGILKKLFYFDNKRSYALVQRFINAPLVLCQDQITDAKIDEHILAFYPPRSVTSL